MCAISKWIFLTLIGWTVTGALAAAAEGGDNTARLLLAGLKDGRDRLRQGVLVAKGRPDKADTSAPRAGTFRIAFDLEAGRKRYEITERAHFGDHDGHGHSQEPWSSDVTHYYIGRPDMSITYQRVHERDGPGQITIWAADRPPAPGLKIYDVRAAGLQMAMDFARRRTFSECMALFEERQPTEAVDEGDGIWRLSRTTQFPAAAHRYVVWIDRSRGFSATKLEEYVRPAAVDPKRIDDVPWFPQWTSAATWTEINEVWVPAVWKIESWKGKTPCWSYTFEFEWASVNEPPPDGLFEIDSLNATVGTLVTNALGKQPFIERVIGDPD